LYVRQQAGASAVTAILCDGIVCDGFIYKYLWNDLTRVVSVAHWHYRGHGRSALPADPQRIDVAAHAADLDAVRIHIGDPPAVLVGHSFGTQVCLEAYRLRPDGVRALVMLCGSFGRVTHTFKGTDLLANVLPELIDLVTRYPRLARGLWSRVPARAALRIALMTGEIDARTIRADDVEPYFRHVAHVDFEMFLRMLRLAGEHSAEDLLPKIQVPVLIVAGDKDSFTPPAIAEAMAEVIPQAELLMIPGGTHVAPLEHDALVALRIEKFFRERGVV
jgi:pimeloyl-ACP methyl ester carboxylesterase